MTLLDSKKVILSAIVLFLVVASYGAIGQSQAATTNPQPVVVTDAYWYSANSTQLISPGSNYVPLFVQFEVAGSFSYLNVSVDLTYYNASPFSYSYITGPNVNQVDYYNLTATSPTQIVTVNQIVNVSSNATGGIYQLALQVSTNVTPGTYSYVPFKVAVLGTPQLSVVNYYTNPPAIYQDQKYVQLTAVISNTGAGPAKNMLVVLTSSDFTIITKQYNVSYFPSGTVENFTFLMNARNITGQAPVTLSYGPHSEIIPLYLNNHGSLQIQGKLPPLSPGVSSALEQFNVTNIGNKTMYDLNVHLLSPSVVSIHIPTSNPLAALTADNFTIAKLLPGQTIVVTYIVDVSSSAAYQQYPAQLIVQWNLNNTAQTFHQVYVFNENISPTALQSLTSNLTFTPLNIGVLVLIVAIIAVLSGLAVRSRRKKKQSKVGTKKAISGLISDDEKNAPEKKS